MQLVSTCNFHHLSLRSIQTEDRIVKEKTKQFVRIYYSQRKMCVQSKASVLVATVCKYGVACVNYASNFWIINGYSVLVCYHDPTGW